MEDTLRMLGSDHSLYLQSVGSHAMLLQEQGEFDKADQLLQLCCERAQTSLGAEHVSSLIFTANLCVVMKLKSEHDCADRKFSDCLVALKRQLGEDHYLYIRAVKRWNDALARADSA
jgi:hypothetical protein